MANPSGSGYLCSLAVWNPTDTSTIVEGSLQVTSPDLTSWGAPSALMLPYDSWDKISAGNRP